MSPTPPSNVPRLKPNGLNTAALALVWTAMAISSIVFFEPAPVDALLMGLTVALPLLGLVAVRPPMAVILLAATLWAVGLMVALTQITDDFRVAQPAGGGFGTAVRSAFISIYLLFAVVVLTGFVALRPVAHTRLMLSGLIAAGLLAATTAVLGYTGALGPLSQAFVLFDRASGTFKDPNVLGSFLVLPLLATTSIALHGRARTRLFGVLATGIIAVAILLSFSRGAWLMTAVGLTVFAVLAFLTAPTNRSRLEIMGAIALVATAVLGLVGAMLQSADLADFFAERAQLFQSYDAGPEGRFGGQLRAVSVILDHPAGISATQFVPRYHPELPHNVYLFMFLNGGWVTGLVYASLVFGTLVFGLIHALRSTPHQQLFIAAYAGFVSLLVIGFFVDTHHWRHFYVNAALVWGMMVAAPSVTWQQVRSVAERPAKILRDLKPTAISGAGAAGALRPAMQASSPIAPPKQRRRPALNPKRRQAQIAPLIKPVNANTTDDQRPVRAARLS